MKVICARKELYEGVQTASRAVSPRSSLPILGHLLFTAEEDRLRIAATDLEIGMECVAPAKVAEQGSMTAPARVLLDILASLPETDVEIGSDESNTVSVNCATSDFSILGLPPEEFPMLPEIREEVSFAIERETLRGAIRDTEYAISTDESRAILTGMLLQIAEGRLKLVSTDTHRLCLDDCALIESQGTVNAIVPGRAMRELMRIVPEGQGSVSASISSTQIMFKVDDVVLISRLIEGQFPNFERVIPADYDKKLIVPTELFLSSVKRASIVVREGTNRTILSASDGKLTITAESGSVGKAHEEVEIIKEGEDLAMAFNAKYLLDMLTVVQTEAVEITLTGKDNPAVIRPQGREDYTYVLMPMHLQ